MEERIKALEGINYVEWQKLKVTIDNYFYERQKKNTLILNQNVLDELNILLR